MRRGEIPSKNTLQSRRKPYISYAYRFYEFVYTWTRKFPKAALIKLASIFQRGPTTKVIKRKAYALA